MKYLITGGSGFLGSAWVRYLAETGASVRVLDNQFRGRARRLADVMDRIEFIEGDVRDAVTVVDACRGIDAVGHFAYINGTEFFYSRPDLVLEVAVKGIVNVLDGCRLHGVQELLLISSSEVYQRAPVIPTGESVPLAVPDPLNPRYSYGGGKIISELMALHLGRTFLKRTLVVRPHNVYGPDMGFEHVIPQFITRLKDLKAKGPGPYEFRIQGTGKETRAFVFVDDFVAGVSRVLSKGNDGEIFHVGTDEERTIASVADEVARAMDAKIRIASVAAPEGGTSRRCPDVSKLKSLGYAPAVSFGEGIRKTVEWYVKSENARNR